ncbi:MAG: YegS/Rv2252/BmrU family lipid kinase [Chloroflexi bacterium]|nr:YegS/Rv2252/BmrU family lipid kinase [Chloroflexota bacterium]
MRVKVILNPCADLGRGFQQKKLIETEGEKWSGLDLTVTDRPGHARKLARLAAAEGYDVVVAAGGDGTVHEVVNGLKDDGDSGVKLGVIPVGSGNDFAYAMNIPEEVPLAVERIFQGRSCPIDLAEVVDDRGINILFGNNLGVGFDANVVIRVRAVKRLHGFPRYFWGVLKTLALDFRPFQFQMRFDDESLAQDVLFVAFGLGARHGGGFMLTPNAQNDDNLIDTCTVRPMNQLMALFLLNSAVHGTHVEKPQVTMRQSRQIEISCSEPLPVHIDGEVFANPHDDVHRLTIRSVRGAIDVMV